MDVKTLTKIADNAVSLIVSDIESRRGIGNEWECTDFDIQLEIRKAWRGIVLNAMMKAKYEVRDGQ